jgi:transporter family protein
MNAPPTTESPAASLLGVPRWLVFTILTLLLWGGWGLVSKPLSAALSAWQVQAFSSLGLLPVIAVLALGPNREARPNARTGFWLAFAAGLLGSLGNVAYYQALAAGGKAAAVTPLTALYPLVTIGLALLVLRERLNAIQGVGALLALGAVYCFNVGAGSAWLTPWLAVALVPIALWGGGALLQKLAANRVSAERATLAFLLGELPVALVTPLFVRLEWGVSAATWGLLALLGLLFALGNLTLIQAYGTGGQAAIVTPLASLYSVITIPLAVLLLGERISGREAAGIALALLAAVALARETPNAPQSTSQKTP